MNAKRTLALAGLAAALLAACGGPATLAPAWSTPGEDESEVEGSVDSAFATAWMATVSPAPYPT